MDQLFRVMTIFIEYPVLAAVIGIVLVGLGRRTHHRVAVGAGVAWLLYALYEIRHEAALAVQRRMQYSHRSPGHLPVLMIALVAGCVSLFWARAASRPPT